MTDEKTLVIEECKVLGAEVAARGELADEKLATFYLRRLADYENARKLLREQFAVMAAQIDAAEKALAFLYGAKFKAAVDKALAGGRKKSIDYPTGRAGYRRSQPRLLIHDALSLEKWCVDNGHGECIRVKSELDKRAALKAALAAIEKDGEVPAGCEVVPPAEEFYPAIPAVTFDQTKELEHESAATAESE